MVDKCDICDKLYDKKGLTVRDHCQTTGKYRGSTHQRCNANYIVCSCHVTYAFQNESTLYICLNVKELLARNRREI